MSRQSGTGTINLPTVMVLAALAVGAALLFWMQFSGDAPATIVQVKIPQLSQTASEGRRKFEKHCVACHGENASGTNSGPPLIHRIYEPSHHGDQAFYLAVQRGVRAHHWPFGNMEPLAHVSRDEVSRIIRYVRELQRANGIH